MRNSILLVCLLFAVPAFGQSLKTIKATQEKCAEGAKYFAQNKIKESFSVLKEYWPMPEEEINDLIYKTETQLAMVSSRFGKILSSDYIKSETAGDSFTRHTFTIKFEKHAVRYLCVFYKPKDIWLVNSITWDDDIDLLF